jgi:hypothetical protein
VSPSKRGAGYGAAIGLTLLRVATAQVPPPTEAPPVPSSEEPAADAPIEVSVEGFKSEPSVSTLTREEVRQLPGAFGDPFRAIEILPGVTPIVSGLPFFYVRGAPPGNVGYFLDGVRVPYLFHAAAGPSVIHPGLVERVDLHAGGYPAQYGRFAGAVVTAEATPPRADLHGEGNLRIVDTGGLVEVGFAEDRFTALLGGRFSYTAALFSLISPEITLDYRDFQARLTYDVTPNDRLTLFAFGAYDFLSTTDAGVETVLFGSEFYRVDGRYDVKLPGGGTLRAALTGGFDQTRVVDGRNTRSTLAASRLNLTQPVGDDAVVRAGLDVQHDVYRADPRTYADPDDPDTAAFNALFPPRNDAAIGAYADVVWRLDPRLQLTPGVRVDGFFSAGASAGSVDPRLAAVIAVTPRVRLLHSLGLAHQPPSFLVPVPGLAVASLRDGLQRSIQAAAGVEIDLPLASTASLTVFNAVSDNLSDTLGVREGGDDTTSLPRSFGASRGFELYLRRSLSSRIGGFIAYTFSRTTRNLGGLTFPAAFDRPHVLHSAVSADLGHRWRAGTRFSLYSGAPIYDGLDDQPITARLSPSRDPVFYRLDLRVEKKWLLGDHGFLALVIEMLNATLNTETIGGQEVGPVSIPSIGVEGAFF